MTNDKGTDFRLADSDRGDGPFYNLHRSIELRENTVGLGLFVKEALPTGTALAVDEVPTGIITRESFLALKDTDPERFKVIQHFHYEWDVNLVAGSPDEVEKDMSYFINHSCEPSTRNIGFIDTNGVKNYVSVSARDLKAGDEVTMDYAWWCTTQEVADQIPKCFCGSKLCRGKLSMDDWKRPDLQERYQGQWYTHVQDLIDASN